MQPMEKRVNSDKIWGGEEKGKVKQGDTGKVNPHLSAESQSTLSKRAVKRQTLMSHEHS